MDHVLLRRRLIGRAALVAVVLLLATLFVVAGAWRATGGRWMTVESGSMGRAAPVGTLVLTRPTAVSALHTGDIVSFRTPVGQTYTHRVVKVDGGVIRTRGDNNDTVDPYRTTSSDLVGKVVARWWAMGFVLRAVPYLAGLPALLWLLTWRVRLPLRTALRLLGTCLVVAGIVVLQHPLVGVEVSSASHSDAGVRAGVVSTGILPVTVHAAGGTSTVLEAGQLANATGKAVDGQARLPLTVSPRLTGWWLVAVVIACGTPSLVALRLGITAADSA